ncbi:hypothetical protein V6N11_017784 [Hibiscus sabdariffa]|uniref:Uncharacterized protein n=1 Tax=Hibiscus sabdariffa TaxID=183260 RepID=A0ABR2TZ63_9ROSI
MQGAEGLAATAWLALRFVRAACWVGYLTIVGMMAGATDAPGPCGLCSWPHASLCATTGPFASLSVVALVEGFASFRPITVVTAAAGRLAWLPSFFFAWCASMPMPMLRSLCFRPTLVLAADFVSSIRLVVGPVQWSAFSSVVAAIRVDWSKEQPSRPGLADGSVLGLLAAAVGAPLLATFALFALGVSAPCARAASLACTSYCGCSTVVCEALPPWPGPSGGIVSGHLLLPTLPYGCHWNRLISQPGLINGYFLVLQVTFIGPTSAILVSVCVGFLLPLGLPYLLISPPILAADFTTAFSLFSEHQEFDEWCAARSRTPPANAHNQPTEARASSIPPPQPHTRQASSSDPSRAKSSRASTSSTTRIPSVPKAGMSSVNNSPAETAR